LPHGGIDVLLFVPGVGDQTSALLLWRQAARRTRNVTRDPWVSLCVMTDRFFGEWVQVDGEAEVVHLPEAMEPLVDYYRAVAGEHPDWDEYRAAMQRERRVLIRVTLTRAGPDVHG